MSGEYNKAWVAAIMAALTLIELSWGIHFGISEEWVVSTLAILTPILVWLVPNRP